MTGRLPVVAVVGRPNVGKSTFFNRVVGSRLAIVDDTPGVTRDRNFARVEWAGRAFYLVDTGGVIEGSNEPLDRSIRHQALAAVDEADVIVLLTDGQAGVHPLDEGVAELLRPKGTPVVLVVNKMDRLPEDKGHLDFWSLGVGEPVPVSAISGKGSGDLLDRIIAHFPEIDGGEVEENEIRIAVIGKPNVGKSSLVNRLFGEERSVVSAVPGTTRDPIDSSMTYHGTTLTFVDTAGLRRQSRVDNSLEYYSSLRTDRVVRMADVCVLVIDATEGVHHQDLRIAETAWEAGCGLVALVNKWDLVEKETSTAPHFEREVRERAPFFEWVPTLFVSAETGQRVRNVLDLVIEVHKERARRIATAEVNTALEKIVQRQPPPHHRGRAVKLKYMTQVDVAPPTFAVFANFPQAVPDHYIRFIHNEMRARWGFKGSPIRIRMRSSTRE